MSGFDVVFYLFPNSNFHKMSHFDVVFYLFPNSNFHKMTHFGVVFYLFPNLNFSKMSQTFFYVFTWVMKIHRQKRAQMHDCIHEYCTAHILIMFQWIEMNFIMLHWSSPKLRCPYLIYPTAALKSPPLGHGFRIWEKVQPVFSTLLYTLFPPFFQNIHL